MANSFSFFQVGQMAQQPIESGGVMAITPPPAPVGYQFLGIPQPLSTDGEGWWIVYAINVNFDVLGMLTYNDDGYVVKFLVAQEAILSLFALLDHLMDLAADCPDQFSNDHMQEIYALWQAWKKVHEPGAKTICVWCWIEANPDKPFPAEESSCYCQNHKHLRAPADGVVAS